MEQSSRALIGRILHPQGTPAASPAPVPPTRMTFEQIVNPSGVYTGPERRAQGAVLAEVTLPQQNAIGASPV